MHILRTFSYSITSSVILSITLFPNIHLKFNCSRVALPYASSNNGAAIVIHRLELFTYISYIYIYIYTSYIVAKTLIIFREFSSYYVSKYVVSFYIHELRNVT